MSHERNIKWLNDRKVKYRQDPINDKPTIENNKYKHNHSRNVIPTMIAIPNKKPTNPSHKVILSLISLALGNIKVIPIYKKFPATIRVT